jgi:predicted transcriptional regulator
MTTTTNSVRDRRERLDVARVALAIRSGVSISWLAAIEAGMQPIGSKAVARVEAVLDELERDAAQWRLEPGIGVSGYRDDTDGPTGAAA